MHKREKKFISESDIVVDVEKRTIQGYFSKYTPDQLGEVVRPGAFTKTISERGPRETERGIRSKIKLGFNHGPVIGIPILIHEDSQGGYYEGRVDKTALGDDILTRIDSGSLDGGSFEYHIVKASYPKGDSTVTKMIEEVKLYELGPVDYPMHEDAEITGLKNKKGYTIGYLCDRLLELVHSKQASEEEAEELKALYSELTERMTVAVEETLPEVKAQPKNDVVLENLIQFRMKMERLNSNGR